jgi:putative endonuclease
LPRADYSIYLVRCADGSLYTGIAVDVARRFREHRLGARGAKYLRGKGPLQLAFVAVAGDRSEASRLEYRVKQLGRAAKEDLVAGRLSLESLANTASA